MLGAYATRDYLSVVENAASKVVMDRIKFREKHNMAYPVQENKGKTK